MTKEQFEQITSIVIDKLEGGYFHPDMYKRNPVKFEGYGSSGETMFGLDRHAGHDLYYSTPRKTANVQDNLKYIYNGSYKYKTPEAQEFWQTIDKVGARSKWNWLDRGGENYTKLRLLASQIIYTYYLKYADRYLTPEARAIVESNPRLAFHFSYAVWNGPDWFKRFANVINDAVKNGTTDPDKLLTIALDSRRNSSVKLIRNGGNKMAGFIYDTKLPELTSSKTNSPGGSNNIVGILMIGLLVVSGYVLYKKFYA